MEIANHAFATGDIKEWKDIKEFYENGDGCFGIKTDGTVAAEVFEDGNIRKKREFHMKNLSSWKDIKKLEFYGYDLSVAGLKEDGTVILSSKNEYAVKRTAEWKDIVDIYTSEYNVDGYKREYELIGIKADGTLVSIHSGDYGQTEVGDWENIGFR